MAETNPDDQSQQPPLAGAVISPGSAPAVVVGQEQSTQQPQAPEFDPETTTPAPATTVDGDKISWTASEFVAHEKSASWYLKLAGITVLVAVAIVVVTRDVISALMVFVGALAFGYYAGRQPRQLEYQLDERGIRVGEKQFSYGDFRSFSVVPEGAFSSIVLMPLKRFAQLTTIYFPPEEEQRIVERLAPHLPFEEYNHDAVDRLMRRVRF